MSKKKKKNAVPTEAGPSASEETSKVSAGDEASTSDEHETEHETDAAEASHAEDHGDASHDAGHGGHDPVEDDRPRNGLIVLVTVVSCIVVVVFCVAVREIFNYYVDNEIHDKVLSLQSADLRALRASEQQKLTHYQWVSKKDGVVRVPSDRAVELTIAAYRQPPVAPPLKPEPAPVPQDKPEEKKDGAKVEEKGDKKGDPKDTKPEDKPKEPKK